ncbi:CopY/TcrY family copper transport repressor [Pseudolactococcus insecticola]|uniref:Transcriptional regulator n=1 Tax=Pseudolactococcus insecticola TaxID=2709158 RepID=A0A6A0B747_9LACT|nr:CopY/TcrY family copper transport repressor [Lactococcus insecticola]GFH40321.1 transcriptional regulator [Lactococcus insecticola]
MKVTISDSEMVVMRAIWTLNTASVDEISCKIADSHGWSVATIKTMLGRLVKKDVLETTKSGRKFIYSPTLSECQAVALMGQDLLDKICAQKHADVIADLIGQANFTAEDLTMIQTALAAKAPVCHVNCDCLETSSVCTCETHEHANSNMAAKTEIMEIA